MNYRDVYNQWLGFDEETKAELLAINDEKEIEDRFYKNLAFGTGGLRGVMGAGANRMNKYIIAKATKGLADYLNSKYDKPSVAVAFDSRNNSQSFADCVAQVLTANAIKVYLYESLKPTPVLSFTVRYLKCNAGVVITASHNPKEYNGYKLYDENGCQYLPDAANKVSEYINAVENVDKIEKLGLDEAKAQGLLEIIGDGVLDKFLEAVETQSLYREKSDLKVVYTALHGSGNIPVRRILRDFDVVIVPEQELPDGNFSTVRSPNPEEKDALTLGIEKAKSVGADIVIGTDPDCDRIGSAVLNNGEYVLVTGNQMGALLVDFVLKFKKDSLNSKSTLVKTIVTNDLGAEVAKSYSLNIVNTLTGFKYIGDQINRYESTGDKEFVIGYEESYGYLVGTHARDKDAVLASMLVCEMASYYKNKGMTLIDRLNELYSEYGYYLDVLDSFVLKGIEGTEKIRSVMTYLRENGSGLFSDIESVLDYSKGIDSLPKENVLKFVKKNGTWFAARPSGTEPKLKVYYSVRAENKDKAQTELESIRSTIKSVVEG